MKRTAKVAGLILMGGKNMRMGGEKKALLEYQGKHFYEHVQSAMETAGIQKIYASVERHWEYPLGLQEVVDRFSEIGPLGGIVTVMQEIGWADWEGFLVMPCDLPQICPQVLELLLENFDQKRKPVALYVDGRVNPLIAIYTKECFGVLQNQIQQKNYRAAYWTTCLEHEKIVFEELKLCKEVVANINSKDEYYGLFTEI